MRIQHEGGQVWLRDHVAPFWALGAFLFAGGALGIGLPLGLAENAGELRLWERFASGAIGLGLCSGAFWWLARSPGTKVHLDLTRRSLRLVRWSILGREVRELPFDELAGTNVQESEDSDGGKVWRPALRLRGGDVLLLSELWSHDERGVRATVDAVAEFCRLPAH
jgi:hypothetical protein